VLQWPIHAPTVSLPNSILCTEHYSILRAERDVRREYGVYAVRGELVSPLRGFVEGGSAPPRVLDAMRHSAIAHREVASAPSPLFLKYIDVQRTLAHFIGC
jgi:hypothetical protein